MAVLGGSAVNRREVLGSRTFHCVPYRGEVTFTLTYLHSLSSLWSIRLEVVTTSTSANPPLSEETPLLGAKWVSLLPAGLDGYVEPKLCRRRRTRAQGLIKCVLWLLAV